MSAQSVMFTNPISLSLSECNATLVNEWSTQCNSAGTSRLNNYSFAIMYESRYNLKDLSTKGISAIIPTRYGTLGATLLQFGCSDFNTTRGAISYSRMFGENISAGFQINYWSDYISSSGRYSTIVSDIGMIYDPISQITFGIHIFNPEESSIDYSEYQFIMPGVISAGVAWMFIKNAKFLFEMNKYFTETPDFSVATEAVLIETLTGRIGFSLTQKQLSAGMGISTGALKIESGFLYHQPLGLVSSFSISYVIPFKK